MAGFRKAKAEQAALKMGIYGPPGSGKTFTSLLIAEGLAAKTGKRVAFVDTERGTDFYCKTVATRHVHPAAFDFDALYTKSLTEVIAAVKSLSTDEYSVVIIDSITHIWEAARAAYSGRTTKAGTIPFHAWGQIKKPYKELMAYLLSSPMHFILCGRQGVEYETDEETEELKAIGVKMKAEGETPYEPHILIRMEGIKPKKTNEIGQVVAYAEKDRTGVLAGRSFINPTYNDLCGPLFGLLGGSQAHVPTEDETAALDADALEKLEREKTAMSAELLNEWSAHIALAKNEKELKAVGQKITPQLKAQMLPADVTTLRERYLERENAIRLRGPGDDLPAINRSSEPNGFKGHVGMGESDRRDTTAEDDPNFLDEARQAAASITAELSIQTFLNDYLGRAVTDSEKTIINGLAEEARKKLPKGKQTQKAPA